MYQVYLTDVQNVGDVVDEINKEGSKIISMTYATDSQQLIIIYEQQEKKVYQLFGDNKTA